MQYAFTAIPENTIPRAQNPLLQHLLDTYASESNKVVSTCANLPKPISNRLPLKFYPQPNRDSLVRG